MQKAQELEQMKAWIRELNYEERPLLYADIKDSTAIANRSRYHLSGLSTVGYLGYHHLILANTMQLFSGTIGNKWGDGVLCLFENSMDCVGAAFKFLSLLEEYKQFLSREIMLDTSVIVRIGLHFGRFYCLPQGWESHIINQQVPTRLEQQQALVIDDELIGADICIAQRIENMVPVAPQVYGSYDLIDQLDVTWWNDYGGIGRIGIVDIYGRSFFLEHILPSKPGAWKGIEDPPPPQVYRIEEINNRFTEYARSYLGVEGTSIGFNDWLTSKGIPVDDELIQDILSELGEKFAADWD